VPLYSAAIDPQTLHSCLVTVLREYQDLGSDIFEGLTKRVNGVTTTLGTFIQVVNDFDSTIERISHCYVVNFIS